MKALSQKMTTTASLLAIALFTSVSLAQREPAATTGKSQNLNTAVDPNATGSAPDLTQGVYIASIDAEERSLRRWAGQKLLNTQGAELGEIRDFIVYLPASRVRYMVVSSGGVLGGMGNSLRLVPIEVLQRASRGNGVEVDILHATWLQIPPISDENYVIDRFDITPTQHEQMVSRFGSSRRIASAGGVPATWTEEQLAGLVRASVIRGKSVRTSDRKVGNIENIIIDLERGTAAALLDSTGDFTGTTAKYLIPLSSLVFDTLRQNPFGTKLTRADFDRAQMAGFGQSGMVASAAAAPAGDRALEPTGRATTAVEPSTAALTASAQSVRRAIDDDPALAAERVQVMAENGKIVLSGSVRSETTKDTIERLARRTVTSGELENRLVVEPR